MSRANDSIFMQALQFGVIPILNRSHGAAPFTCCVGSSTSTDRPNGAATTSTALGADGDPSKNHRAHHAAVVEGVRRLLA